MLNKLIANLPASSRAAAKQNYASWQRAGYSLTASRPPLQQGWQAVGAYSSQVPADVAEGWQAVSGLIKAIWECFQERQFDGVNDRFQVDGYKTFADAALAFDQLEVALQGYKCTLEVCVLELVLARCMQ